MAGKRKKEIVQGIPVISVTPQRRKELQDKTQDFIHWLACTCSLFQFASTSSPFEYDRGYTTTIGFYSYVSSKLMLIGGQYSFSTLCDICEFAIKEACWKFNYVVSYIPKGMRNQKVIVSFKPDEALLGKNTLAYKYPLAVSPFCFNVGLDPNMLYSDYPRILFHRILLYEAFNYLRIINHEEFDSTPVFGNNTRLQYDFRDPLEDIDYKSYINSSHVDLERDIKHLLHFYPESEDQIIETNQALMQYISDNDTVYSRLKDDIITPED